MVRAHGVGFAGVLVAGALGFSCYALWIGQDANWDLQNYHLYVAYALLHWRYPLDVGPGGFQSYLNPLPYVLPYWLRSTVQPPAAAVGIAVSQAFVLPATWLLTGRMPRLARSNLLRIAATLLAATSAIVLSEVGTSFADLTLASLVLAGALVLLGPDASPLAQGRSRDLTAGVLLGMATGLKLTNGVYVAGGIAALVLPWRGLPGQLRSMSRFGAGAALGFAVTGGAWAVFMYASYGNPIFPGLNSWFRSPSAAFGDFTDKRFLPASLSEVLSYPFSIAAGQHPTAENPFADPRLAICLILSGVRCATAIYRQTRAPNTDDMALYRAMVFLWAAYLLWVLAFAIERYAVALEIVAGVISLEIASSLAGKRFERLACLAVLIGAWSATRPADWWHRPWSNAFQPSIPAPLLDPAAFMIVSNPDGYWATILPRASRFYMVMPVGLATGGRLRAQLVAGLRDAPGHQVWTLGFDVPMTASVRANMAALGYAPSAPCLRAASLWWVDTIFCHAAPGQRRLAAADLKQNETADFTSSGAGWIYEVAGWVNAGGRGTSTIGAYAELALRPEPSSSKSVLDFSFDAGPPADDMQILVNGRIVAAWALPEEQGPRSRTVCLADLTDDDGVADLVIQAGAGKVVNLTLRALTLRPAHEGECGG